MLTFFHRIRKRQAMVCLFMQSILLIWVFSPVLLAGEWKEEAEKQADEKEKEPSQVYQVDVDGSLLSYTNCLEHVLPLLEHSSNKRIYPESVPKICIFLDYHSAPGLAPSPNLLDALLAYLFKRGYDSKTVTLASFKEGVIGSNTSRPAASYRGFPRISSGDAGYFHKEWWYDSPLPSSEHDRAKIFLQYPIQPEIRRDLERRSDLPAGLFINDTHWINLAVAMDDPALGIYGATENVTLGACSNTARFLKDPTMANAAVTEILAIPEFWDKRLFSILDMNAFQFAGGSTFDAEFFRKAGKVLVGENPLAVDYHAIPYLAVQREKYGFSERKRAQLRLFRFGKELGLGDAGRSELITLP